MNKNINQLIEKLRPLAKEYVTQDTLYQAMPVYFTVCHIKETVCPAGYEDNYCYVANGEEIARNEDALLEYLMWECDYGEVKSREIMSNEFLLRNKGISKFYLKNVEMHSGCFLTKQACENHIAKNGHRYKNPIPYANTFFRNPEMSLITDFLIELAKEKMTKQFEQEKQEIIDECTKIINNFGIGILDGLDKIVKKTMEVQPPKPPTCKTCTKEKTSCNIVFTMGMNMIPHFGCTLHSDYEVRDENV